MAEQRGNTAVILTGHHRSGTSILALLCNSHPDIVLTNEFGNFWAIGRSPAAYARDILARWWQRRNVPFALAPTYSSHIRGTYMLKNLLFVTRYLYAVAAQRRQQVDPTTIVAALRPWAPAKRVFGDKHPDYVFQLNRLTREDALRCVFIYRDPRDLASSVLAVSRKVWQHHFPPELRSARQVAHRWIRYIDLWQQHAATVHAIRYEDLVLAPHTVLPGLGNWLGVEPDGFRPEMLNADSVGKYRTGLSPQEAQDVLAIAGPTMQRLNYEV